MRQKLNVIVSSHSGEISARVPHQQMWDLVEYLSYQRVHVNFSYEAEGFTVHFRHIGPEAAQTILDAWSARSEREAWSNEREPVEAGSWLAGAAV